MINKITNTVISSVICSNMGFGGEPVEMTMEASSGPDFLKFSLGARLRYEARNQQGLDASHALTLRARPGLTIFPYSKLSFYVESEHTFALVDDFQVGTGQSANFDPFKAGNTAIVDPENNELNQAFNCEFRPV